MNNLETLPILFHLFKEAQKIKEYYSLSDEFNALMLKVEDNQEMTDEDNNEFYRIIKIQWKRIIIDTYSELNNKIKKRKTKGQKYQKNIKKIEKIRRESERDIEIGELYELFRELITTENEINEKISIEKYQINQFWKGLLIGSLFGIFGSIVVALLL